MNGAVLSAKELSVGYGAKTVVSDVNVDAIAGQLIVLIGANGSGKSTLLRTIAGAQPPIKGKLELSGQTASTLSAAKRARLLSIVLTDRNGAGGLRVDELVAIGRYAYSGILGRMSSDDKRVVKWAIEAVGLADKTSRYVGELSDGERQKAMIARAIAQDTPLIILDEPTSFLDVSSRIEIINLLANLTHNSGKTILLSTHDTAAALPRADYVWVINDGRLDSGRIDDLAKAGLLNNVFSGVTFDTTVCDFRENHLKSKI